MARRKFWKDSRTLEQVLATPCPHDNRIENIRRQGKIPAYEEIAEEIAKRERKDAEGIVKRKSFLDKYIR